MSAAFTPGPWKASHTVIASKVGVYCDRINPRIGDVVIYTDAEDEGEANARLIAAAPELYAALNELMYGPSERLAYTHEKARAALAEARGEQS